jgi:hypothetical protein
VTVLSHQAQALDFCFVEAVPVFSPLLFSRSSQLIELFRMSVIKREKIARVICLAYCRWVYT